MAAKSSSRRGAAPRSSCSISPPERRRERVPGNAMPRKVDATPHRAAARKPMTLALQGGGAHGAFTWGVLDRLLEEPALDIEAISGTSAGAMNAAALADGMARGG